MYNAAIIGSIIVILLIILLMRRTTKSTNTTEQKKEEPIIICRAGPRYTSRDALIDILSQFERNIVKAMKRVDQNNHYSLQVISDQANKDITEWIKKQTDPSFRKAKEKAAVDQENDIENERQQIKDNATTISDLLYNSKKENDSPVEDNKDYNTYGKPVSSSNKTKQSLTLLSRELGIIVNTIDRHGCILIGPLDIRSLESLMDIVSMQMPPIGPAVSQPEIPKGRNNSQIMACYTGTDCGLDTSFRDTSSVIIGKSKKMNHCFPQHSVRNLNTSRTRFNTIVR